MNPTTDPIRFDLPTKSCRNRSHGSVGKNMIKYFCTNYSFLGTNQVSYNVTLASPTVSTLGFHRFSWNLIGSPIGFELVQWSNWISWVYFMNIEPIKVVFFFFSPLHHHLCIPLFFVCVSLCFSPIHDCMQCLSDILWRCKIVNKHRCRGWR